MIAPWNYTTLVLRKTTESSNQYGYRASNVAPGRFIWTSEDFLSFCIRCRSAITITTLPAIPNTHTLSETLAWFSGILGCMFPKTSLMIIGYRRVFLVIAFGLDQAVGASDRAEILMPRSLQANCNQVWSRSIHGDRWWNKRVWTSWWIKRIWEPRIWSSCWFYCCSTGLTVIFPIYIYIYICGVCV